MNNEIETGPIRPPSEAESLLLRVTRNCSWNKCKFCGLYKHQRFSTRPIEEIKSDIDKIAMSRNSLSERIYNADSDSVFLQDANTMALSYDKLREILIYLREKLPDVKRVTSYGRVDSLAKFSAGQFAGLREAGLDRIHSGYESGSDKVLTLINKGHSKEQEIEAGRKVKSSGIELSVYFMPGVGGRELSDENAIETADVVSKTNPDFVRIRTFVSQPGTELMEDIESGLITECSDMEKMLELKKMIENINGADGRLYSDHIINLHEDVRGDLAEDKEKMLAVFEAFEKLDSRRQKRYQLARRMGMVRSLSQMGRLSGEYLNRIDMYLDQIGDDGEFDNILLQFLRRYI